MTKPYRTFHSHVSHNPECDILEEMQDQYSYITYGVYVSGPRKGEEFMEYYSGDNYVLPPEGQTRPGYRSYSRCYSVDRIPKTWRQAWEALRTVYLSEYLLVSNMV